MAPLSAPSGTYSPIFLSFACVGGKEISAVATVASVMYVHDQMAPFRDGGRISYLIRTVHGASILARRGIQLIPVIYRETACSRQGSTHASQIPQVQSCSMRQNAAKTPRLAKYSPVYMASRYMALSEDIVPRSLAGLCRSCSCN